MALYGLGPNFFHSNWPRFRRNPSFSPRTEEALFDSYRFDHAFVVHWPFQKGTGSQWHHLFLLSRFPGLDPPCLLPFFFSCTNGCIIYSAKAGIFAGHLIRGSPPAQSFGF